MKALLACVLLSLPALAGAETYRLREEGDFVAAGYRLEAYDRFGWRAYRVSFDFGLDPATRTLSRGSTLKLELARRKGGAWSYTCKAKRERELSANVNFLYGTGISVVASCRLPAAKFAKAVGLDPEDVGQPTLVFEALIQGGQVTPGAQRGMSFAAVPASSELAPYAAAPDAEGLAVLFH